MKIFKGYTNYHHRLKASIVERYITKEAIEFCTNYLSEVESIGIPKSRHADTEGRGIQGLNVKSMARDVVIQAYFYILNNLEEVQPYVATHRRVLKKKYPRMSDKLLLIEHNKKFLYWFNKRIPKDHSASETIKWLSFMPKFNVITWTAYDIGHYTFYTKSKDDRRTMQNSGVMVEAESMCFSSSKDKNPILVSSAFYGVIEEIWEMDYVIFRVPLFKCKRVPNNINGVQTNDLRFTLVDPCKENYMSEPFIMASQAKQVFYVTDPSCTSGKCSTVLRGKYIPSSVESFDIPSTTSYITKVSITYDEVDRDDVHAIRIDHNEGIWKN